MKKINQLLLALLALASVSTAIAQENPWMVRVRATNLSWANKQDAGTGVKTLDVNAKDRAIPEFDISYFFNKNVAAELVLSYPQEVDIRSGSTSLGKVKALPPSLVMQYHFTNFGQLKPYLGAGVNYTLFSSRSAPGAYYVERSSTGFVGQVGADYMLDKKWGLNLDVKYIQMKTKVLSDSNGADNGTLGLNPLAVSLGVTYKF